MTSSIPPVMVWAVWTWCFTSGEAITLKALLEVSKATILSLCRLDWPSEAGCSSAINSLLANTIDRPPLACWVAGEAFADAGRGANVDASGEGTCGWSTADPGPAGGAGSQTCTFCCAKPPLFSSLLTFEELEGLLTLVFDDIILGGASVAFAAVAPVALVFWSLPPPSVCILFDFFGGGLSIATKDELLVVSKEPCWSWATFCFLADFGVSLSLELSRRRLAIDPHDDRFWSVGRERAGSALRPRFLWLPYVSSFDSDRFIPFGTDACGSNFPSPCRGGTGACLRASPCPSPPLHKRALAALAVEVITVPKLGK